MKTIFLYNENCVMAGRPVPIRELEEYEDPSDCHDWSEYEVNEETAEHFEQFRFGPFGSKIANSIRNAI